MNYLGHSFLSFGNSDLLFGNMIGDFVKGTIKLETYPPTVQKGIRLHRKIDEFSDKHIAHIMAKNFFKPEYKLYAGAFIDVAFDYFLANDPRFFASEAELFNFTQSTYLSLAQHQKDFPEKFAHLFPYMESQNWLYNYRTVKGIEKAFQGLVHKAAHLNDAHPAYRIFISHFYELNQRYYEFIDDVVTFAKKEIENQNLLD